MPAAIEERIFFTLSLAMASWRRNPRKLRSSKATDLSFEEDGEIGEEKEKRRYSAAC